jgi:hypothetical protein
VILLFASTHIHFIIDKKAQRRSIGLYERHWRVRIGADVITNAHRAIGNEHATHFSRAKALAKE